jgi:hypothetical protein
MPNGGITPDCIHCQWFRGTYDELQCGYHNIHLAYPIRAFCSKFADGEPADEQDWLDEVLNRSQLDDDMMYLWLEKGYGEFLHVPLVSLVEYDTWTRERFLEAIEQRSSKD